ncbi:hypothetical protein D3C80_1972040 [compost metagenome]
MAVIKACISAGFVRPAGVWATSGRLLTTTYRAPLASIWLFTSAASSAPAKASADTRFGPCSAAYLLPAAAPASEASVVAAATMGPYTATAPTPPLPG